LLHRDQEEEQGQTIKEPKEMQDAGTDGVNWRQVQCSGFFSIH